MLRDLRDMLCRNCAAILKDLPAALRYLASQAK